MDLSLKRSFDVEEIKSVFTNPQIWATIAEDNQDIESFNPDPEKEFFLGVYDNSLLIGFYAFAAKSSVELDVHVQILPKHRKKYALASGHKMIDWFINDAPANYLKLTAQIPFKYPDVKNFALSIGFEIEGINKQSYRKDGKIYCQWYLGHKKV